MAADVPPADPAALAARVAALEAELDDLRARHATFAALLASVPDFVVRVSPSGVFEHVNRLAPGLTLDEVIGRTIYDFTDPAHHPAMRAAFDRVLATGLPTSYETYSVSSTGPSTPYLTRIGPIVEDGRIVALTMVATDVSQLRDAARRLAQHREQVELAAEAADIGYWHWDAAADAVVWDAAMCRHFGLAPGAAPTTYATFLDLIHPVDRDRIRHEVDQSVASGRYAGLQFRALTPDGELRWLMTSGRVERDARGAVCGLIGCLLDITERRRHEEQRLQTHRLEAVGQLATGVAHNFNNLLAALIPALELTARRAPSCAALLGDLQGAAERAADVVRQLTAFAGGAPRTSEQTADAAEIARRVASLARGVLDRAIALEVVAPATPVVVRIDAGELEQALMNLVLNARDALAPSIADGRPAHIRVEVAVPEAPRGLARVVVHDDGVGMTEEIRRRAIDPFFTTKPPGHGTGLGLSSVYAMAAAHGGALEIDSCPRGGTAIALSLPVAPAATDVIAAPAEAPRGRGESILLVDDDPTVRAVIAAVLEDEGYRVRDVGDPQRALDLFADDPTAFDAAIVDHSMPGLSGPALLDRMLAIAPRTRVISFSGLDLPMPGVRARLDKPVSIDTLLATMRRVLDEA